MFKIGCVSTGGRPFENARPSIGKVKTARFKDYIKMNV